MTKKNDPDLLQPRSNEYYEQLMAGERWDGEKWVSRATFNITKHSDSESGLRSQRDWWQDRYRE